MVSNMSNELDNIITLAGKFEKWSDLQAYCDSQYTTIKFQNDKIRALEEEIKHLKTLLSSTTQLVSDPTKKNLEVPSNEQLICEVQLEKLKEVAKERELTLEETKRFDLLNKNLLLIKNAQNLHTDMSIFDSIDPQDLLKFASLPDILPDTSSQEE